MTVNGVRKKIELEHVEQAAKIAEGTEFKRT